MKLSIPVHCPRCGIVRECLPRISHVTAFDNGFGGTSLEVAFENNTFSPHECNKTDAGKTYAAAVAEAARVDRLSDAFRANEPADLPPGICADRDVHGPHECTIAGVKARCVGQP